MMSVAAVTLIGGDPIAFRGGSDAMFCSVGTQTVRPYNSDAATETTEHLHRSLPSLMSSNPRNYNTEDRVRWERYADAFRDWLAKRGPYPGEPPAGYLEVYKTIQRYAPCPHEYAALVSAELRTIPGQPHSVSGVSMSSDAFSAMLSHQSAMQVQMADLARQLGHGQRGRGHGARGRGRHGHRDMSGRYDRGRSVPRGGRALSERLGHRQETAPTGAQRPTRRGRRAPRNRAPTPEAQGIITGDLPDGMHWYTSILTALLHSLSEPDDDLHGNDDPEGALEEPREEEDVQALPFERDAEEEQPMAIDGETREWTPEY
ncbi:hypothetical protein PYCCODRAFT_557073 [Trametes coccinea BRFM310]|uniref:Uncharacterized protein n=1 Tax=Trametes coccinea (strain BRFM310) TaxID=1353009 RepID=A0A1Y2IJA2_TRAC3|nr:hypothetical protein PYCCODRAFT_557073 [Trametes coccinea BRFM310]